MNKIRIIETFNSLVIILFFIMPYNVVAAIDISLRNLFYFFLIIFYFGLALFLNIDLFKKKYYNAFLFTLLIVISSGLNQWIYGYVSFFRIIAPFVAYLGYIYAIKYKFSARMFTLLMIGNYIYFIYIYYSKNSLDFFIPDSQMNTQSFINTSTNLIPAVLIINLYAYDLFNHFKFNHKNDKLILIFAIVNFLLILLQRSRAGIVVSLIFLLMKTQKINTRLLILSLFTFSFIFIKYFPFLTKYLDSTGGMTNYTDYVQDARGINIAIFFNNMDFTSFILGHGTNMFKFGQDQMPMSMFFNIWNYYGFFVLLIFLLIITKRFLDRNKNMISPIYLLPFLAYSLFETFFFPNFWDFFIFLILFYKYEPNNLLNPYDTINTGLKTRAKLKF
jgi:hypothetical protein